MPHPVGKTDQWTEPVRQNASFSLTSIFIIIFYLWFLPTQRGLKQLGKRVRRVVFLNTSFPGDTDPSWGRKAIIPLKLDILISS